MKRSWLLLLLVSCTAGPPVPDPQPEPAVRSTEPTVGPETLDPALWTLGEGEAVTLAWRCRAGRLTRNEEASLEVRVFRDGRPVEGARLSVRGWMPDHRHGLVQLPEVEDLGAGRFAVRHLLLHMRGHWQLVFSVGAGTLQERVAFDLEL